MPLNSKTFKSEARKQTSPTMPKVSPTWNEMLELLPASLKARIIKKTQSHYLGGQAIELTTDHLPGHGKSAVLFIGTQGWTYSCNGTLKGNYHYAQFATEFLPKPPLPFLSWADMSEKYAVRPEPIISGLLRRGDTGGFIGATKSKKTWMVTQLAVTLAAGDKWLKFQIPEPRKVLVIDNELQPADLKFRYDKVCTAMDIDADKINGLITFLPLRGNLMTLEQLSERLNVGKGVYDVVILDSLYKFLPPGMSENDNNAMTRQMCVIDRIATDLDATVIFTHHASKGRQDQKATVDAGAGAGALSRSTDLHFVCSQHQVEGTVAVAMEARNQVKVEDFCITFENFIFHVDPEKNPAHKSDGSKVQISLERMLKEVPERNINKTLWIKTIRAKLNCSQAHLTEQLEKAIEKGYVTFIRQGNAHLICRSSRSPHPLNELDWGTLTIHLGTDAAFYEDLTRAVADIEELDPEYETINQAA